MARLTAKEAGNARSTDGKVKRLSDGENLYLVVRPSGSKSWILRARVKGRRTDIGLGAFPSVTLAGARRRAADTRAAILDGVDVVEEKHKPAMPTFREAAQMYFELHLPNLQNGKHRTNWMQVLQRHAFPALGNKPVNEIERGDVLRVLEAIWVTRPPTARRVRQRIRKIMGYCVGQGWSDRNVAGEDLQDSLPVQPTRACSHYWV